MERANQYQREKAKAIAGVLLNVVGQSSITLRELPELAARMSNDEWRTVSFAAGVPVADLSAKQETIQILRDARRSQKVVCIR